MVDVVFISESERYVFNDNILYYTQMLQNIKFRNILSHMNTTYEVSHGNNMVKLH